VHVCGQGTGGDRHCMVVTSMATAYMERQE
jgi:hypothetical protein